MRRERDEGRRVDAGKINNDEIRTETKKLERKIREWERKQTQMEERKTEKETGRER